MALSAVTRNSQALTAAANDKGWFDWHRFWEGFTRGFTGGLPGPFAGPSIQGGLIQSPADIAKAPLQTIMGLTGYQEIIKRVAIGLGGIALIAIGANMISRDMGLQQAAVKFGSQLAGPLKGVAKVA